MLHAMSQPCVTSHLCNLPIRLPQYERCLAAFQEAKALGVAMDVRAYNIALRACHTPGKTLRQEQLMQASLGEGHCAVVLVRPFLLGSWAQGAGDSRGACQQCVPHRVQRFSQPQPLSATPL